MRIILFLIAAILIGIGGYTVFQRLNFEPVRPAPLVFKEPDPETLKQLGIYTVEPYVETATLTVEQQKQAGDAVAKIAEAMNVYRAAAEKATPQLKSTLDVLNGLMASGKLPAYFLNTTDGTRTSRAFAMLKFDTTSVLTVQPPQNSVDCLGGDNPTNILIGDNADTSLNCERGIMDGDQIFLSGPGNDKITSGPGNRIVNAGSGNDLITLGPGRSILVLEDGWGNDEVNVDCSGAHIAQGEIPPGFPVPWVSQFTNFIVLSPRIQPGSVAWNGNALTNSASGDTLTVNENCFTVIGAR